LLPSSVWGFLLQGSNCNADDESDYGSDHCSLRSAHGKGSLKFGLFDKFIRIAIKLEKQDGWKILHSVA